MSATPRCRRAPRGWWCSLHREHWGPCAAYPRWWNLAARLWVWRQR